MSKKGFPLKFLGSKKEKVQKLDVSWQSLSDEIDQLCQTIIFGIKIDSSNAQQVLVASLYIKILSTFQAVLLLVEREMMQESKTLMRSMMEAMFALVAISKDPTIATRFIEDDHTQRLKLTIAYDDLPPKLKMSLKPRLTKILNSSLNGLVKPTKTHDITPLTTEHLARKAGLEEVYYSIFSLLSGCNYLRVYELEQYWNGHFSSKSLMGLIHPDASKSDAVLFSAIKTIFLSLNGMISTFQINVPRDHIRLIQQFRRLTQASKKKPGKPAKQTNRVKAKAQQA